MSEASAQKRVTRRTIAKGAAWTVPAVVVAAPAASAASSPPIIYNSGESCKVASVPDFRFVFDTTLPEGTVLTVTSWTWTPNDGATSIKEWGPITTTVNALGQLVYVFVGTSSTNGNLYICFSWPGGSQCINTGSNSFANCEGNPSTYPVRSPGAGSGPLDPPVIEYPYPLAAQSLDSTEDATLEGTEDDTVGDTPGT